MAAFYLPQNLHLGINHAHAICSRKGKKHCCFLLPFLALLPEKQIYENVGGGKAGGEKGKERRERRELT